MQAGVQAYRPQGVDNHKDILLTSADVNQFLTFKWMNTGVLIVELHKQF